MKGRTVLSNGTRSAHSLASYPAEDLEDQVRRMQTGCKQEEAGLADVGTCEGDSQTGFRRCKRKDEAVLQNATVDAEDDDQRRCTRQSPGCVPLFVDPPCGTQPCTLDESSSGCTGRTCFTSERSFPFWHSGSLGLTTEIMDDAHSSAIEPHHSPRQVLGDRFLDTL